MVEYIVMELECLGSVITSAIEVYPKETKGFLLDNYTELIGSGNVGIIDIGGAYPSQTDRRRRDSLTEDGTASSRVVKSLNISGNVIGKYHSHPYSGREKLNVPFINDSDIDYALEGMKEWDMERWLEVILSIKKRRYEEEGNDGLSLKNYPHRFSIRATPFTGFEMEMWGFWINKKGNYRGVDILIPKISRRKRKIRF